MIKKQRIIVTLILVFFTAMLLTTKAKAEETKGTDIYYDTAYIPDGYTNFVAYKGVNSLYYISYFDGAQVTNIEETSNKYKIKLNKKSIHYEFRTLENLARFINEAHGETPRYNETSNSIDLRKEKECLYASNYAIKIGDIKIWEKHSYIGGQQVDGTSQGTDDEDKTGILNGIKNLINKIITAVTDMKDSVVTTISDAIKNVTDFFTEIRNFIKDIPELAKKLFIPSQEFMVSFYDEIKIKFGFIYDVIDCFDIIKSKFNAQGAFKLNVNLPKKYGGNLTILDFNMFENSIKDIRKFTSSFLWIGFILLIYKRLPSIISGGAAIQDAVNGGKK